jgi:hypothetical protein
MELWLAPADMPAGPIAFDSTGAPVTLGTDGVTQWTPVPGIGSIEFTKAADG